MSSKIQVLVADDATFIRDLLKKSIRTEFPNCEISEAIDGKRAISHLKRVESVDLILCDWEMPEASGEEVLKWVRSQDRYKDTQFIMVTSRGDKEHIVQAAQAGVNGYLVKPFKNKQLLSKVKKALKQTGKLRQSHSSSGSIGRSGFAAESVDVLTSSFGASIDMDFDAPPPPPKKKKPLAKKPIEKMCKAQLRTSAFSLDCLIESVTTKKLLILAKRDDAKIPTLLEQAVIDLAQPDDAEKVARINTYISKLECAEDSMNSRFLHIGIMVVDDDAEKTAFLEEFIRKQPT